MALAVIRTIEKDNPQIGPALLLGVAYSASIGGMATLIGTPPNLVFSGVLEQQVNEPISFIKWMSIALPVSVFLLFITWWIFKKTVFNEWHLIKSQGSKTTYYDHEI